MGTKNEVENKMLCELYLTKIGDGFLMLCGGLMIYLIMSGVSLIIKAYMIEKK